MRLFLKDADFGAFERMIIKTLESCPMRIMGYCLLSNHWHLVLWPERDGDLGTFMQKLTITHARNWQVYRRRVGYGHLYQGRYKSFPIESDEHFYQVLRYVERNALRAKMVRRADDWRNCSLWRRLHGPVESRAMLSDWPLPRPRSWLQYVNQPQSDAELKAIRLSVQRGQPYGGDAWARATAARLGLVNSQGTGRTDHAGPGQRPLSAKRGRAGVGRLVGHQAAVPAVVLAELELDRTALEVHQTARDL